MKWVNGIFSFTFFRYVSFRSTLKTSENLAWCFQGDQKETLGRKGLKNKSFSNFGKYPSSERSFENPKLNLATY